MNEFSEMEELAQMAESMGEGEPVIERPDPEPVKDQPAAEPMPSDMAGGLDGGEVNEDQDDGNLDLEALFGVQRPDDGYQPADQPAKGPTPEHDQTGRDARIKELADENREIRRQLQLLTERALRSDTVPAEPKDEAPSTDPEVIDFLRSQMREVLGFDPAELKSRVDSIDKTVAPLAEKSHDQRLAEYIAKRVPGFSAEHMATVRSEFEKYDKNSAEFAEYGDGVQGATLLALDLVSRGALNVGQSKAPRRSPLTRRLHSEASGPSRSPSQQDSESEAIKAMFGMSDDEFRRRDPHSSLYDE